jgi:uncharacterized membrane protein YfcA|eukprot:gnl/Ergobibamus_cyprinoides/659.p1 GENE.gnl/Ergobibamus_cyprinoides/659~~gnl/Ergobibamus_cyprinoides/659.p1  ORF type:complete len:310 (-),score=111.11 gnl/Ergobibamus_cyprinoides/659:25-933(-)
MDPLPQFALIWLFLGPLAGAGTAVIAFSSWALVMPIMLILLNARYFDAIAVTLCVDAVSNSALAFAHSRKFPNLFRPIVLFALVLVIPCVGLGALYSHRYLADSPAAVKSFIGILSCLVAIPFIRKGRKLLAEDQDSQSQALLGSDGQSPVPKPAESAFASVTEEEMAVTTSEAILANKQGLIVMAALCVVAGVLTGVFGNSGGMFLMAVMHLTLNFPVPAAIIGGNLLAAGICISGLVIHAPYINWSVSAPYIFFGLLFTLPAALVARTVATKIPRSYLNLSVGAVTLVIGLLSIIELHVV